jgi:tRNA pseudouridine38-40 synthase
MKRNIKLLIEYDGTDFVGWQRQPNGRTVQEEIENSLKKILQEEIGIVGAGRTDSGVHARGQVANFITRNAMFIEDVHRALNGVLPEDIVIHNVEEMDEQYSARYSAKSREYRYYISNNSSAIERKFCWHAGYQLDIEKMNHVAASILGIHDFQSFCKSDSVVEHHLCNVIESRWMLQDSKLTYIVCANRFLQGMVRALVGTMVNVGRSYISESEFTMIMDAKNRSKAGQAVPAKGLFLERVTY